MFLLTICFLLPLFSFSQVKVSAKLIERSDASAEFSDILHISIGTFINDDLLFGITNEKSYLDYINFGHNPIQDSLIVSDFQFFVKYFFKRYFLALKVPISSDIDGFSTFDNLNLGAGYIFLSTNNFDFDVTYDLLLIENINGMRKGRLTLGLSTDL